MTYGKDALTHGHHEHAKTTIEMTSIQQKIHQSVALTNMQQRLHLYVFPVYFTVVCFNFV